MSWRRGMLTDSGGFQMVSLLHLADITEDGVTFQSPVDGSRLLLTPEESIGIQNNLGADIMMQLDDVCPATCSGAHGLHPTSIVAFCLLFCFVLVVRGSSPGRTPGEKQTGMLCLHSLSNDKNTRVRPSSPPLHTHHADPARFEEAAYRTTRWLDRCMAANRNPTQQNLFPIVQGGFDVALREVSMQQVSEVRA